MKLTKNQLQRIVKEEINKVLFEDDLDDYKTELDNWEKAAMYRKVAQQALDYYQRTGEESHLKRYNANLKKADKLNPSGQPPDREAGEAADDARDARVDAGDVINMRFANTNKKIDVDDIIKDELNRALLDQPFRLAEAIDDMHIANGNLNITLKSGSSNIFPEDFWKHLEEDINAAIEEENRWSSMAEGQRRRTIKITKNQLRRIIKEESAAVVRGSRTVVR